MRLGFISVYKRPVNRTEAPSLSQAVAAAAHTGASNLFGLSDGARRGRGLPMRTLIALRWLSIIGQATAVLSAYFVMHFPLPLWECLATIGASAVMNIISMMRARNMRLSLPDGPRTGLHLGFDILQLSVLLALTGGLTNPFCLLLVAPVSVAAASLSIRQALVLGAMAVACVVGLYHWSLPLPWLVHEQLELPGLYRLELGLALMTGMLFISGYTWKVAADAEKLELALATTQDVLQREQRLAAIGGLAAAAAHELGTPLATIQIVAREMLRSAPEGSSAAEDAALILQQAGRCRDILNQLSSSPDEGDALYADVALKALLQEVAEPHLGFDLEFEIDAKSAGNQPLPRVKRLPEIIHGLSALVENAADFATSRVSLTATVDAGWIAIDIVDDGPGFASDVLPRLGEPYVTTRPQSKARRALAAQLSAGPRQIEPAIAPSQGGMGLGFFIARTLLERTGAKVSIGDGPPVAKGQNKGAHVSVRWPRQRLEATTPDDPAMEPDVAV